MLKLLKNTHISNSFLKIIFTPLDEARFQISSLHNNLSRDNELIEELSKIAYEQGDVNNAISILENYCEKTPYHAPPLCQACVDSVLLALLFFVGII